MNHILTFHITKEELQAISNLLKTPRNILKVFFAIVAITSILSIAVVFIYNIHISNNEREALAKENIALKAENKKLKEIKKEAVSNRYKMCVQLNKEIEKNQKLKNKNEILSKKVTIDTDDEFIEETTTVSQTMGNEFKKAEIIPDNILSSISSKVDLSLDKYRKEFSELKEAEEKEVTALLASGDNKNIRRAKVKKFVQKLPSAKFARLAKYKLKKLLYK